MKAQAPPYRVSQRQCVDFAEENYADAARKVCSAVDEAANVADLLGTESGGRLIEPQRPRFVAVSARGGLPFVVP